MKRTIFKRGAALALVGLLGFGPAHAALIDGALNFSGEAVPIPGPGLASATGLSFTSGFFVTDSTGTFAGEGVDFGDAGTIADFFFNPLSPNPVDPLITLMFDPGPGKFSFSLDSVDVMDQSANFLVLSGVGTLSGTGYDSTPYQFSLSVDGVGSLFAFSGTLAPAAIPLPGGLVLLLSGLTALGFRRRG